MSIGGAEAPEYVSLDRLFRTVVPPIVLPVFLAAADSTIVATALPAIGAALGHVELLSWVVVVNLIASTIAAPAYGRLADLFGRRRLMLAALVVFSAAALLCAGARSMWLLLIGRAVQGLGGGGLMTLAQALIGEHVPARARGQYQGYLAGCIVAGSAFGPVAGGLLTQAAGWPAVFLAYLPLGVLAMLLVARLPRDPMPRGPAGFDLVGAVLLTGFVVPLLVAVARLQRLDPETLPLTMALAAAASLGLWALIAQQRRAPAGLLALPLLRLPAFWRADVMAAGSGASLVAMVTFLPLYLVVVTGASAAQAGLLLMPLTVSVSSGSVLTGWLIGRTGHTAIFPAVGLMITALTLVALALWAPGLDRVSLSALLVLGGLCQGSAMLTAQITVQSVASPRQLGAAAASVQLARSLGSAFGAAVAGAVLFGTLAAMDHGAAGVFFELIRRGPEVLAALPPTRQAMVQADIADAFRLVFLTVASFSVMIAAAAWTTPLRRL
ncbi:MAG TPA: MFS transporter [Acetobacteraceae bacterium]|nr:MFS transporter [Acetobacteraceae bacterium]